MASLPPRHQAQRRPARPQNAESSESQRSLTNNTSSLSTTSLDSQTLLLNSSSTDHEILGGNQSAQSATREGLENEESVEEITLSPPKPEDEPRRCWICFSDETEDTPQSSAWRSPCPCALTAHEQCLLDWVADMEKPQGSSNTSAPKLIRCPQCKSEIHLSRPRNKIVEAVNVVEKLIGRAMWPGVFAGFGYTLFIGASHHGAHTIRMIFGSQDAQAILAPQQTPGVVQRHIREVAPHLADSIFRDWRGARLEIGLPLIPLTLIASRTTIADAILPVLPILFFATHPDHSTTLTARYWPPSAALTLVVLPYVRGIYDDAMERVWGHQERAWLREIRPRLGETEDQENEHDDIQQADNGDAQEAIVEVQFDLDLGEADHEDEVEGEEEEEGRQMEAPAPQDRELRAPPLDAPPLDEEEADRLANNVAAQIEMAANNEARREEQQLQGQQRQQGGRPARQRHEHSIDLVVTATRAAETIFGALLFPSIASGSGELLRLLFPSSLTTPKIIGGRKVPTGLLQTKWGRSIIGGCLFVALKDALRIYCRWRMAQAFRTRRVLDWDKVNKRTIDPN